MYCVRNNESINTTLYFKLIASALFALDLYCVALLLVWFQFSTGYFK